MGSVDHGKGAKDKFDQIGRLISRRAFSEAKNMLNSVIEEFPEDEVGVAARFMRARAYEDGMLGEVDRNAALQDFSFLMNRGNGFESESIVGCARVLYGMDKRGNADAALALCMRAIDLDLNSRAMMLMGFIFENTINDVLLAKKWYLMAYKRGVPWGLRYYADVEYKYGNRIIAILLHVAATVTSPFMILRYGLRGAFK